ncbi:RDD family protein [Neoehrlichia mikurensis]|uniref:RDD family protein n=1 Tax=Neoehrlichia mikurensis TaxID=89586 RepID=A0A9Q9C0H1_9RICK|nr:RDD family protein [Neoehrlichia mikurensis]QXK91738.1 RDD family protein [Neoehrlichia mikurensis]QXK92950.1 RDD family protein [Neoehrlichia mikurensis]QXK93428.1 RDD family protein [Neoehrlichia mikurensis]UTO55620.1 RDD family protein [Neoehrlichia mikurensis]UTO56541.1 RDD family protein [Neoehrlichia mikurensis]
MNILATIPQRIFANIIDSLVLLIFTFPFSLISLDIPCIFFLYSIAVNCSYYTYFLSSSTQATIGQKFLNIHIIKCNNNKINIQTAFDRTISEFLCPVIIMILTQIVNIFHKSYFIVIVALLFQMITLAMYVYWYLIAIFSHKRQTIHDILFDTIVVIGKFSNKE